MSKINKHIKKELFEFFDTNLNGEWTEFKDSLDDIRIDMNKLSDKERKAFKTRLKIELDKLS